MTSKKRGLGRGLNALIPTSSASVDIGEELREIKIDHISPRPEQPRMFIDHEKLLELVDSIKKHGVVQPVVVRPIGENKYQLIAGERRWRACQKLKKEYIPALIKNYNDFEASAIGLIENIQREDLNAVEEAQAYNRLMKDYGLTQEGIAQHLGKSRSFIANMVRLLNLPVDIKDMLMDGSLSVGHARALIAIKDENQQMAAALKIVRRNLNVRQTEEMVKRLIDEQEAKQETKKDDQKELILRTSEEYVERHLGTPVTISKNKGGKGKIVIRFQNDHELQRLVKFLGGNVSRETV